MIEKLVRLPVTFPKKSVINDPDQLGLTNAGSTLLAKNPSTEYTLPTDQLFNMEFQFESVFNLEFQPKFGIQLGNPISMGINLGECTLLKKKTFLSNQPPINQESDQV